MPKLETWVAFGSLGMGIMFIALMLSFLNFLIGPKGNGPNVYVDPTGVVIQLISIAGAPSIILAVLFLDLGNLMAQFMPNRFDNNRNNFDCRDDTAAWMFIPKIEEQFSVGGFDLNPLYFHNCRDERLQYSEAIYLEIKEL